MTRLSRHITDLWPFLFTRESFRVSYLYMSHWDVCISMWCSRCLWWPPTVNLAHALRKPPLKPTGRSEATFRCEVGLWHAERDEDICHASGSSASPQHPSRWVSTFLFSFHWSSFSQWAKDTWCLEIQTVNTISLSVSNQILPITVIANWLECKPKEKVEVKWERKQARRPFVVLTLKLSEKNACKNACKMLLK